MEEEQQNQDVPKKNPSHQSWLSQMASVCSRVKADLLEVTALAKEGVILGYVDSPDGTAATDPITPEDFKESTLESINPELLKPLIPFINQISQEFETVQQGQVHSPEQAVFAFSRAHR